MPCSPRIATGPGSSWLAEWLWPTTIGAIAVVFLLFPDGRLLSSHWRPMLRLAGIGSATAAVGFALTPGRLTEFAVVHNLFGLEGADGAPELVGSVGSWGSGSPCWLPVRHWFSGSAAPEASSASS
jgi:hypothetical protein